MANTKKYVSFDKLSLYDEKIKKVITDGDAASLASAKEYANSLATNYDPAGSAATVQGNLDTEIARAKAAEEANAAAAKQAQDEVDALELVVKNIQENAYDDTEIRGLISGLDTKKADKDQVALDIAAAVKVEEDARKEAVAGVQGAVDALSGTHATDKAALEGKITAEETRATEAEAGLASRIKAIEDDYLVEADKTALQGKIDEKAAQTALDAEIERATGVEEGLQNQINLIMNNPDTKDVIDSITEFTQYIADHGEIADGFRADIDKNKEDIAAMDTAYKAADSALSGRIDTLEAIDHEAYIAADTALKNELNGEIAKKADSSALTSAVEALEQADAGQVERIAALEAKFTGEGSVEDLIEDAMQGAIDTAAADATSKANTAESNAKSHADSLNTAMNTRVEALEAIDHEHANKAELDLIVSGDKAKWDEAYGKMHEHANKSVIDGITAEKVAAWDAAEGNAKTFAQGLNDAMDTRVATLETWHANFVECSQEDINSLFA